MGSWLPRVIVGSLVKLHRNFFTVLALQVSLTSFLWCFSRTVHSCSSFLAHALSGVAAADTGSSPEGKSECSTHGGDDGNGA